jgi:hypothetical protein
MAPWLLAGSVLAKIAKPSAPLPPGASSEEAFQELLKNGDREQLQAGCVEALSVGLDERLRLLRPRLLEINAEDHALAVVLADAKALLVCKAPEAALQVLNRVSPAAGKQRETWFLLQWQAANDALSHRRAALALKRFSQGSNQVLAGQLLTVGTVNQIPIQRSALDLQAQQLEASGAVTEAIPLLLESSPLPAVNASRRFEAARLLGQLGEPERAESLIPDALNQSAQGAAWGLSAELLNQQRSLQLASGNTIAAAQTTKRQERLAKRLDDSIGVNKALLARIADGSTNPPLTQKLLSRQQPLELHKGLLLTELLNLGNGVVVAESQASTEARLELKKQLAQKLNHRERLLDLLAEQENQARIQDDSWLLDRVNREALQNSAGNPLRELEALDKRLRELTADPSLGASAWEAFTPMREQGELERLREQEQLEKRRQQKLGFDPYPGLFSLPALLEDLQRLRLATPQPLPDGSQAWRLAPAQFGALPRQIGNKRRNSTLRELEQTLDSLAITEQEKKGGLILFSKLVQQLQLREDLSIQLSNDLIAGKLQSNALDRQVQLLFLERQLDPNAENIRALTGFGRTEQGRISLSNLHQQEDRLRLRARVEEARNLKARRLLLEDQLQQEQLRGYRWQPRAPITAPQLEAIKLTRLWRDFRVDPTSSSAAALQDLAYRSNDGALELELLRYRLQQLLPPRDLQPANIKQ